MLVAPGIHEHIADFMALGAPHVFVINPGAENVDRWIFQESKSPRRVEQISADTLHATIRAHHDDWGPGSVLRAKSIGAHTAPVQLDFADYGLLPALEREAHKKLDQLFGGVSNVDMDGNNAFQIKALGVVISTFETLPSIDSPHL